MKVKKMEDWKKVAQEIAAQIRSGTIIALSGPLGAGKTTLVQALAKELGCRSVPKSPTFSLVRTYKLHKRTGDPAGRPYRLIHVDAYRIEDEKDVPPLGLEELVAEPGTVMAIEWPDNVRVWLNQQENPILHVTIDMHHNEERRVKIALRER